MIDHNSVFSEGVHSSQANTRALSTTPSVAGRGRGLVRGVAVLEVGPLFPFRLPMPCGCKCIVRACCAEVSCVCPLQTLCILHAMMRSIVSSMARGVSVRSMWLSVFLNCVVLAWMEWCCTFPRRVFTASFCCLCCEKEYPLCVELV